MQKTLVKENMISVFHWEIDVCQSSNMFKYVILEEYPSYVHNIPPALVLKGVCFQHKLI